VTTHTLEPKTAKAFIIKKGQHLRITDIDGQQAADFVCFSEHDHGERFSQAKTRVRNLNIQISTGNGLISNRDNTMFTIVDDTVGVHDIMLSECHSYVYEHIFKVGPRNGCYENLSHVLAPYDISSDDLPDPFDIFTDTEVTDSGDIQINTAASGPGDYIELRAEMDCIIGVSACPDDVTPCNGGKCTRIGVEILN
jgi:uncharacterized protein YcgI (DUF1989 family)